MWLQIQPSAKMEEKLWWAASLCTQTSPETYYSLYNLDTFLCYCSLTILSHYCHVLFMSRSGVVRKLM